MICELCKSMNYPGVSIDSFCAYRKMICRNCLVNILQEKREQRNQWINSVKIILLKKLQNNEPMLVNTIFSYLGYNDKTDDNIELCTLCHEYIHNYELNIGNYSYYYYICCNCLNIS